MRIGECRRKLLFPPNLACKCSINILGGGGWEKILSGSLCCIYLIPALGMATVVWSWTCVWIERQRVLSMNGFVIVSYLDQKKYEDLQAKGHVAGGSWWWARGSVFQKSCPSEMIPATTRGDYRLFLNNNTHGISLPLFMLWVSPSLSGTWFLQVPSYFLFPLSLLFIALLVRLFQQPSLVIHLFPTFLSPCNFLFHLRLALPLLQLTSELLTEKCLLNKLINNWINICFQLFNILGLNPLR